VGGTVGAWGYPVGFHSVSSCKGNSLVVLYSKMAFRAPVLQICSDLHLDDVGVL
jgi:hypothetical protein